MSSLLVEPAEFLSVAEVSLRLRISKGAIYEAVRAGRLPAFRLAEQGSIRIPAEALVVGRGTRARDRTPSFSTTRGAVEAAGALTTAAATPVENEPQSTVEDPKRVLDSRRSAAPQSCPSAPQRPAVLSGFKR